MYLSQCTITTNLSFSSFFCLFVEFGMRVNTISSLKTLFVAGIAALRCKNLYFHFRKYIPKYVRSCCPVDITLKKRVSIEK